MEKAKISRAALGRFARLGDLYDARKDEFLSINGLKSPLSEDDIFEDEANTTNVDFILTDSIDEKFDKLNIDAELSLSIMSGLIKLSGSAAYLNNQKSSAKSARMTLTYAVMTIHQEVEGIRSKVDKDCIDCEDATHIVVGIGWGAKCNITCEYESNENEDDLQVKGKLQAEIEKLKNALSAKGSASVDFSQRAKDTGAKFSYHSNCDVSDLGKDIPSTFEGAMTVATTLPSVVLKTNDGKGVPVTYTMLSLNSLRKMCKMEQKINVICRQIESSKIKQCSQIMQKIDESRMQINDLVTNFVDNKNVISDQDFAAARDFQNRFEIEEARVKSALAKALVEFRSEKEEKLSAIDDVLQSFLDGDFSPNKIEDELRKYDRIKQKLRIISDLMKRNVLYLGRNATLELALHQNATKKVYVLYMDFGLKYRKPDEWNKHTELFFRLMSSSGKDESVKLIVLDCELQPAALPKRGMCIEFYDNGVLCCEDVAEEEGEDISNCTVKFSDIEPLVRKPNKRVPLEISCPNSFSGRCKKDNMQWVCKYCKEFIDYGLDDKFFYCACGRSKASAATFRCNDVKHGLLFIKYNNAILTQILNSLRMVKETNILILGETGVGKSTWINAIANYLDFSALDDARMAEDMKVLIPSQFSYTSETGSMHEISVGSKSTNEILKAGQSATQGPKAYKFFIGNHVINLIDTPGIGDVRGLEQDEKNFENILAHLSYYDEIHGICILLKPNDSRLTVTFRFCITELLTHLHKSAAENIIFCFTNARSTFYRPGDTLPMLKSLISEYKDATVSVTPNNLFCFDNESFRFLSCLKNGIHFEEQDIETYSSSWRRAVIETERLFKHILSLKPHSVQHTVSLNNARRIILELSKPLAETAANIQVNIDSAEKKAEELEASNKTASELQDRLYLDALELEPVHLSYPRTVCTHSSCVEHVQVSDSTKKTVYSKHCHAHCYLSGVPTETVNNSALQGCAAMGGGPDYNCNKCGHSWRVHMHMTYDLEKKTVRVIDKHQERLLNKEKSHATKLADFINDLKIYCSELKEEQKEITDICAQFGCYLKKNAITPFNDEIDAHLKMLIKQEKNNPCPNQSTIDNFENMRRKYEQKKIIISKAMENPNEKRVDFISDPHKVEELKKRLFRLKHNGASLERIFSEIKRSRNEYHYNEMQVAPVGKRALQKGGLWNGIVTSFKSAASKAKSFGKSLIQ